jgi:hypothetical protein
MKDFLDKIGTYNIFNYLLPGVIFSVFITKLTPYNLVQEDALVGAFVYYFIGSVVSRIGSLIIGPFLKWIGFVSFSTYEDFVHASKADEKIELLSEVNNMYRTICSLSVCIGIVYGYGMANIEISFLDKILPATCVVGLLVLFTFSYRKQTMYIKKRVEINKSGVSG